MAAGDSDSWAYLSDDMRAWLFKHFTPAQVQAAMRARGLDRPCEDPAVLTADAKITARAIVRAERAAA